MALSFVPSDDPKNLESTTPVGCQFEHDSGAKCGSSNLHARGYCSRHYKQLERSGVFQELRQADQIDHLVSINADKLLKAKSILEKSAPYAARLMIKASKVAADKGDHRPAKDVLLLSKAVEEPQNTANKASTTGVVIKVGVALAGLDTASTAIRIGADDVVDASPLDKLDEH